MPNFSPEKFLLVGMIALVVLGPGRLPQAARSLGRLMAELRRMSSSFQDEVREAMGDSLEPITSTAATVRQLRPPDVRKTLRDTLNPRPPGTQTGPPIPPEPSRGIAGYAPGVPDDPTLN